MQVHGELNIVKNMQPNVRKKTGLKMVPGFSLVELIVVMAIALILAVSVVSMFSGVANKLKGEAFALRGDLNLARAEAVNRNTNVLVKFVFNVGANSQDGYSICVDVNASNVCGDVVATVPDIVIKDVLFAKEVQFYDTTGGTISGGPDTSPNGTANNLVNNDGITFSSAGTPVDYFYMQPDGTVLGLGGTVVIYAPKAGTPPTAMAAEPYAVVVANTGRVRLERWRGSIWKTK